MSDDDFLEFVLDQLSRLSDVTWRKMFGGVGFYQAGTFFAIIADGRLYLRVDDESRQRFKEHGMKAFEPMPGQFMESYYEVPVDVLEDDGQLTEWARRAVVAQKNSKTKKTKKKEAKSRRKKKS